MFYSNAVWCVDDLSLTKARARGDLSVQYLPIFTDLTGKAVLLIGGGHVALRKARALLDAGAVLTVVSHQFETDFQHWAAQGKAVLLQGDFQPDLTLLLDAPVEIGLARMNQRGEKDRIEEENAAFFNRVRESYLQRAKAFPERFSIIHADQSIDHVQAQIKMALDKLVQ